MRTHLSLFGLGDPNAGAVPKGTTPLCGCKRVPNSLMKNIHYFYDFDALSELSPSNFCMTCFQIAKTKIRNKDIKKCVTRNNQTFFS